VAPDGAITGEIGVVATAAVDAGDAGATGNNDPERTTVAASASAWFIRAASPRWSREADASVSTPW
jgi:hypothetical protein